MNPRCWYQFKPLAVRLQALALLTNPVSLPPLAERRRIANRTKALNKQPFMESVSCKELGSLSPPFESRGLLLVSLQKASCKSHQNLQVHVNSGHLWDPMGTYLAHNHAKPIVCRIPMDIYRYLQVRVVNVIF